MPRMRASGGLLAAVLLLAGGAGCTGEEDAPRISLEEREKLAPRGAGATGGVVRFAVGAMLTPQEGHARYFRLLQRVEELLGRPVKLVDRPSYAAINEGLERGEIDFAFVCSGPYVEGKRRFGLELLAVPVSGGLTTYRSYLIVHAGSPLRGVEELRGRSFAFTDPDSNTGHLVPLMLLAGRGETPAGYFSKTVFTGSHDKSIRAVAGRIVDAAAVDSLIWEQARRDGTAGAGSTRILWRSEPYGIPPVVARPGLDPALAARVREIFLGLDRDPAAAELLPGLAVERFVAGRDEDYDSIRAMQAALAARPASSPGAAPR